jgi:hypothetical protein
MYYSSIKFYSTLLLKSQFREICKEHTVTQNYVRRAEENHENMSRETPCGQQNALVPQFEAHTPTLPWDNVLKRLGNHQNVREFINYKLINKRYQLPLWDKCRATRVYPPLAT